MDKKEVKAKWLEALRSGKYEQGRFYLKSVETESTPNRFCCMGVLCDIVDDSQWVNRGEFSTNYGYTHQGCHAYLPADKLSKELSLSKDMQIVLATMNDHKSLSFSEIADYIEKEWSVE